ncbi:hypothetical protein HDU67_008764 [Dinochytrium kinnereticum]|nr:hypothetical protein HDU67_008764 [Dinochytrium kinnereticum]
MELLVSHPKLTAVLGLAAAALLVEWIVPKRNATIPSTPGFPFIGNTLLMLDYVRRQKSHELVDLARSRLGPISRSELFGGISIVTVSDAESIKRIFCSEDFRRSAFVLPFAVGIFQHGLFIMPTDDLWRRHRKFLQPGFGASHLRHSLEVTNAVLDKLVEIWSGRIDEKGDAYVTDMFHVASSITLDVIGQVAFSFDYKAVENHEYPESMTDMKAYQRAFEVINIRTCVPSIFWSFAGVSTSQVKEEVRALRETIQKTIEHKRHGIKCRSTMADISKTGDEKEGDSKRKSMAKLDVLDRMLENGDWTDEEITDEVIALFLAGGETSANTIVFCVLLLDQHPEIRDKMVMEIDEVIGDTQHVTSDMINKLRYTEYVIKESLRLYPVVAFPVAREALRETELMGHQIAKGTLLVANLRGLHRDPKYWKYPDVFSPSRWNNFTPAPGTYLPFADGPHACLGMRMAMIELKCVLARIYRYFLPSVVPGQDLDPVTSVTHGLKNGLKVTLKKRTS